MNRKNRDVKFLIYQSLYIFLIAVVAIKGADINLDEVEVKKMLQPTYTYVDTVNNIILSRDEYTQLIPKIDENNFVVLSKADYERLLNSNPNIASTINTSSLTGTKPEDYVAPADIPPIIGTINKDPVFTFPGELKLKQFATNRINNPNDVELIVEGIATIAAKTTGSFELQGQEVIVIKIGDNKKTYETIPNQQPQITIQKIANMNEDTRLTSLQSITGYRVKIDDDLISQIDVKFTGPVQVSDKGKGVYDIRLNAFSSKTAFERFAQDRDAPYKIGFNIIVTDKKAGHKLNRQQEFIFGEW